MSYVQTTITGKPNYNYEESNDFDLDWILTKISALEPSINLIL
jgi:hypothetical protein